ncbi:hypothetical protein SNE40_000088 [Patella caerulea]|uniref:Uncharacterized protein n=1 Tax=Patella caerulea TaxID=87958 RepID=A0AAN8Q1T3_PATCE
MNNGPRLKRSEKFRNTIDPEFTCLRTFLGRMKTTGVIQILTGVGMLGSAVFIILTFKATFLQGQSVGSRITPNLIIGITCLFSGCRAFMMKGEVGFTLDHSGLKCVVGMCAILTIVAFTMSALLVCLASYEIHTLNTPEGAKQYSHVGDRKGLNIVNIVVSLISGAVCLGCFVIFVKMGVKLPRKERPAVVNQSTPNVSVISRSIEFDEPTFSEVERYNRSPVMSSYPYETGNDETGYPQLQYERNISIGYYF